MSEVPPQAPLHKTGHRRLVDVFSEDPNQRYSVKGPEVESGRLTLRVLFRNSIRKEIVQGRFRTRVKTNLVRIHIVGE